MAGVQDLQRGHTLPLIFVLLACLLYILFDLSAYHPSLTPLGIYNMYACNINESLLAPAVVTDPTTTTTTTTTTKAPVVLDVSKQDLRYILRGNWTQNKSEGKHF